MKVSVFNYDLPNDLLAREPREAKGEKRSDSRLLVMDRKNNEVYHKKFPEIIEYLNAGDVVVLNNSETIKAHLIGWFENMHKIDVHLCGRLKNGNWQGYIYSDHLHEDGKISFGDGELTGQLKRRYGSSKRIWEIEFFQDNVISLLDRIGRPIISPYVNKLWDIDYYKNEYAFKPGSAELPAAGRHFTKEILEKLRKKGVFVTYITLHTGLSSIEISSEHFEDHKMHEEEIEISRETADVINEVRSNGKKVIGVGTTVVRTLESVADHQGQLKEFTGYTDLYIYPGYKFKVIDAFITNFHGAKSSRIAMAAAFTGSELLLRGYREAIDNKYLFYEFGDATLTI